MVRYVKMSPLAFPGGLCCVRRIFFVGGEIQVPILDNTHPLSEI